MRNQSTLTAHQYDVCPNGCMLFHLNDESASCDHCYGQRFDNSNKPLSTMKIMSLGDIISGLLANPITRQDLEYRHNYDNREEDELSSKIADVFDGEVYKSLKDRQMFRNTYDQCIAIYNDGFVTDKRGSRLFTIIHVILFNQAPNKRYKDENMLQIAILPGPKKPASFNSFVSVILAEIQSLSTYGMIVKTPDNQTIRSKVHCLIFGGDTLGKSSHQLLKQI